MFLGATLQSHAQLVNHSEELELSVLVKCFLCTTKITVQLVEVLATRYRKWAHLRLIRSLFQVILASLLDIRVALHLLLVIPALQAEVIQVPLLVFRALLAEIIQVALLLVYLALQAEIIQVALLLVSAALLLVFPALQAEIIQVALLLGFPALQAEIIQVALLLVFPALQAEIIQVVLLLVYLALLEVLVQDFLWVPNSNLSHSETHHSHLQVQFIRNKTTEVLNST